MENNEEVKEVPRKNLREQLDDLLKRVDSLTPEEKAKKKFPIPMLGLLIGLIGGGFVFTMTWLLSKSINWGIGVGIIVAIIIMYISKIMEPTGEWKLPWSKRFLGKKKKRKGYVVFVNLGLNKAVTFIKAPISEGVAEVNGVHHVVSPEDIFLWKNKIPLVFVTQWAEKPINAKEHFKETQKNGEGTEGWAFIMNYMLKSQITAKKSIPWAPILIGALVLIGLGFYAMKSGVFK